MEEIVDRNRVCSARIQLVSGSQNAYLLNKVSFSEKRKPVKGKTINKNKPTHQETGDVIQI